jgi:hypothetical protein
MKTDTKLQAQLYESLLFAQTTILGSDFMFEGKTLSAKMLTEKLFGKIDESRKSYLLNFALDNYEIKILVMFKKSSYTMQVLVKQKNLQRLCFTEEVFPIKDYDSGFSTVIEALGIKPNLLMANPAYESVIGLLVSDVSKKRNFIMPLRFNRPKEINQFIRDGDVKIPRKTLRIEYAEQKNRLLPQAQYALQLLLLQCLKKCYANAA